MKLILQETEVRGQNEKTTTLEFEGSPAEIRREVREAFEPEQVASVQQAAGLATEDLASASPPMEREGETTKITVAIGEELLTLLRAKYQASVTRTPYAPDCGLL
jgi:hypothetical protein